ncbi:MAG: TlpA family protein disulfide reductase [Candidatus Krumholzibacteriota bacterium]|nr:TlpA family protein disulfide reductase [Candidatus Krumholzibacteriota bacterium]
MTVRLINRVPLQVAVLIVLVMATVLAGCSRDDNGGKESSGEAQTPMVKRDPNNKSDVILRRIDGSTTRVSDYGGKFLFVTFFATWNIDSQKMIPIMNNIQKKYYKNVDVIGVSLDSKNPGVLKTFLIRNPATFEIMVDGERTANAFGGARNLPVTYILLRDGTVATKLEGLYKGKKYEEAILALYRQHL